MVSKKLLSVDPLIVDQNRLHSCTRTTLPSTEFRSLHLTFGFLGSVCVPPLHPTHSGLVPFCLGQVDTRLKGQGTLFVVSLTDRIWFWDVPFLVLFVGPKSSSFYNRPLLPSQRGSISCRAKTVTVSKSLRQS